MKVTLTHYTENPLKAIEEAACNCYDSKISNDGRIAKACYKSGHTSVFEFCDFTFHIEGLSRAALAQLTRHRVGCSFAVRSQRYCSELNGDWVTPKSIEKNKEAVVLYNLTMRKLRETYDELCDMGISNEDARFVLPNAWCTTLELKMTGRALIHFCNERLCTHSQWEIRELAQKMKKEILSNGSCTSFAQFLVPKCMAGVVHYCTEKKGCGLCPPPEELNKLILTELTEDEKD